jgi:hypothetical protein
MTICEDRPLLPALLRQIHKQPAQSLPVANSNFTKENFHE